jgi:hypothetical protein
MKMLRGCAAVLALAMATIAMANPGGTSVASLNVMGRQQMLLQKLALEVLLVSAAPGEARARDSIRRTHDLFNANQKALLDGSASEGIAPATEPIRAQLGELGTMYRAGNALIEKAGRSGLTKEEGATALQALEPTIQKADLVFLIGSGQAGRELGGKKTEHFRQLNQVRAYTQQLAKELALAAGSATPDRSRQQLARGLAWFQETLVAFDKGDQRTGAEALTDPSARQKLAQVQAAFKPLQEIYKKRSTGTEAATRAELDSVAAANDALLRASEDLIDASMGLRQTPPASKSEPIVRAKKR